MRIDKCAKCQAYHPKGFDYCPKRHPELASFDNFNDAVAYFKHGESPVNEKLGLDSGPVEKPATTDDSGSHNDVTSKETATKRKWRENNRERYNQYMREWKRENADKVREYQREYMRQRRKTRQPG